MSQKYIRKCRKYQKDLKALNMEKIVSGDMGTLGCTLMLLANFHDITDDKSRSIKAKFGKNTAETHLNHST